MTENPKLFMVIMGCNPKGRVTEQHDIFFGIGSNMRELVPQMKKFWPEAEGKFHIDAWREVTVVDGFSIEVVEANGSEEGEENLYFLNLGGYKPDEFEEFHYRYLGVATKMATAIKDAKKTTFFKHYGFKGANSHIDEKYGIDVDDSHKVIDLLNLNTKTQYQLKITKSESDVEADHLHIGYLTIKGTEKLL